MNCATSRYHSGSAQERFPVHIRFRRSRSIESLIHPNEGGIAPLITIMSPFGGLGPIFVHTSGMVDLW